MASASSAPAIAGQCLDAGLLDELVVHVARVLLGDGVRLYGGDGAGTVALERIDASSRRSSRTCGTGWCASTAVTHDDRFAAVAQGLPGGLTITVAGPGSPARLALEPATL